ncbi:MAG: RNA polymerase sigma factor [FCB group bacterium]|nr:RNA polymerase sigma factor [FCB group bacterium]
MLKTDRTLFNEWIEEAQNGNREAFSKIVKIMMKPIIAMTYKMTQNIDSAQDLAQDTFVAAWQNLATFQGKAKFENWVYRIATNKCLNYLKKEGKNLPLDNHKAIHASDDPSKEMLNRELRQNILGFMAQLPQQQRLVFELHFYKELTFEEIAQLTGKALGTVKTLYREAIAKLRATALKKGWHR